MGTACTPPVRAEGVASSFIEGVRAPLPDVAAAELDPTIGEPATWVADNLNTVMAAVTEAPSARLSFKTLHRWHRSLMSEASHLPANQIGAFRTAQGWIGGTSPLDAALVTPPPEEVSRLTRDLVAFANRTDVDPSRRPPSRTRSSRSSTRTPTATAGSDGC